MIYKIRCQGETHNILFQNGKVVLKHHSKAEIQAAIAAAALGASTVAQCISLLQRWRTGQPQPKQAPDWPMADAIQPMWLDRVRKQDERSDAHERDGQALRLAPQWQTRCSARFQTDVRRGTKPIYAVLPASVCRQFNENARPFAARVFGVTAKQVVVCSMLRSAGSPAAFVTFNKDRKIKKVSLHLPDNWWQTVYLKRLAVIDNHFVLGIEGRGDEVPSLILAASPRSVSVPAPGCAEYVRPVAGLPVAHLPVLAVALEAGRHGKRARNSHRELLTLSPGRLRDGSVTWLVQQRLPGIMESGTL